MKLSPPARNEKVSEQNEFKFGSTSANFRQRNRIGLKES